MIAFLIILAIGVPIAVFWWISQIGYLWNGIMTIKAMENHPFKDQIPAELQKAFGKVMAKYERKRKGEDPEDKMFQ